MSNRKSLSLLLFIPLVISVGFAIGCNSQPTIVSQKSTPPSETTTESAPGLIADQPFFPQPVDEFVPEESEDNEATRLQWIEELHRCGPDTDWRSINQRNAMKLATLRPAVQGRGIPETFANGQLSGTWSERGSKNQSGSMHQMRYVPQTDQIYAFGGELSNFIGGRSLWRGNRDGTGWTVLNDDYTFRADILEAFIPTTQSSVRLIVTDLKYPQYSDDEGQTWQASMMNPDMGFVGFGRRHRLDHLPGDTDTVFYVVQTWDTQSSAYQMWIYRSLDAGETFDRVATIVESNRKKVDLWTPESGGTAYFLESSNKLHALSSTSNSSVNCNGLPANANEYQLTGSLAGDTLTLYALIDGQQVYKSVDEGSNWQFVANAPINAWDVGMTCSPNDSDKLFIGGVECYYSYDGAVTWTRANSWSEYYGNIDLLHADMMDFELGQTDTGQSFMLIGNHGGIHATYDELQSTTNIAKADLNVSMYYDVMTHPDQTGLVFLGSQDQGWQWTSAANTPGTWDVVQQISGDFGQMQLTRNNQGYWTQYPGAWFFYYNDSTNPVSIADTFNVDGQHIPTWIVPTASFRADPAANSILVGGGALDGGSGSQLITLTANSSGNINITGSQFDYDFRANSNSNARISAIEQPVHDLDTIYVTTGDGTFFRTEDGGSTWQKTPGFQGSRTEWIFTSTILASKINPDLIWTSGSGYDNPPVFKSIDGGDTFVEMSNGLPDTLVQEIVANPAETLLFAATDVGPYVYVVADDMWYPMIGSQTPINWFTDVEYIERLDIVRFASMGRGVWDFEVDFGTRPSESIDVTRGIIASGSIDDLTDSDNVDLSIRRNLSGFAAEVCIEAELVSPTQYPDLTVVLEASVFARSQITQSIELFNFQTQQYELIDSRNAQRFNDLTTEATPTGDLSRFVDGAGSIRARVKFVSANSRQAFAANVDRLVWRFE